MYRNLLKRLIDFITAILFLIVFSPVFIIISIYCFLFFKGRILFSQRRIGKNERVFTIYKFITMLPEQEGKQIPDSERLTKAGAFLRKTSLDELPQVFNILMGNMSWIGPRPLLEKYLPYYTETEKLRHRVSPGITGLAQINGRNTINWDKRLSYDVFYVQNLSLLLDIKIVFKTVVYILKRQDIIVDSRSTLLDLDVERKLKQE